jgi:hypothetical protein
LVQQILLSVLGSSLSVKKIDVHLPLVLTLPCWH